MKKIAVFGSINIDYFVESQTLPKFGETVYGENFFMNFGGKGANQAVAAARLGGEVTLFGSIGNDEQKDLLLHHFQEEKVNIHYLNVVNDISTGAAFIQLHGSENRIIITEGANRYTNLEYSQMMLEHLLTNDIFIFQLETPVEALTYLIPILYEHKKTIILDPAPAKPLPEQLLKMVTFLTPNEYEVSIVMETKDSVDVMLAKYPNKLLLTCGEHGVKYHDGNQVVHVAARKAVAIDTTGAGDSFTGAFAVALAQGKLLEDCIRYGIYAGSLAVTKKGAQSGMPYNHEIEKLLQEG